MDFRDFRKFTKINSTPSLLGYGCMRFPTTNDNIDEEKSYALLKAAVEGGVNYFDTAYVYHGGKSEEFLGSFLKKYMSKENRPRESYYVADKLPTWEINSLDDAKRIFSEQLNRLQIDYIDFYLLHDLKIDRFEKMEKLGVYDYCRELQKEGKIRHLGHSSHENLNNFTKIVNGRDWDFIMLQLNYMDLSNLEMYKLCEEKGIPVLAMEPVRGGSLSKLPDNILSNFTDINPGASPSSWAIRWTGSLPEVKVILSGMSDMKQVEDNLNTCGNFEPLNPAEKLAVERVETALRKRVHNKCTGCNYCMPCPAGVNIPWCFSIWNGYAIYENRGHSNWEWSMVNAANRPEQCTECGKCNEICPQNIDVINDLERVQSDMESL
ncbi:MAG: aldo/keto reductase [Oscillospiraceae bacterium]|nr:aldo/keto reductase [Oscillospiraceae bacterium]